MISRKQALEELDGLLARGAALIEESDDTMFICPNSAGECQYWFGGVVAFVEHILPDTTFFAKEAKHLISRSNRQGGIMGEDVSRLLGHLRFLRDAIEDNLLRRTHVEVVVGELSDFLDHAALYLAQGQKAQAAVIASAVFEDGLRKLAERHGLESRNPVESLINGLKSSGVLSKTQSNELKYFASIRNAALHASWDEFDQEAVERLVEGTQKLLDQLGVTGVESEGPNPALQPTTGNRESVVDSGEREIAGGS
jgi:hypothetical protein